MATRTIISSNQVNFGLDFIIVVMRVLGWLNVAGFFGCLVGAMIAKSGPVDAAHSAAAMTFGVGVFSCLGSALFCFAMEQILLLGRRAVIALEMLCDISQRTAKPSPSRPAAMPTLPPPP